jgi:hypothetical protein
VFGGYTSESWDDSKGPHWQDDKSFVFSLSKSTVHRIIDRYEYAISFGRRNCLIRFGIGGEIEIK